MPSVANENPAFWVVSLPFRTEHVLRQCHWGHIPTEGTHESVHHPVHWLLQIPDMLPVQSHYSCWANWSCSPFQKGWRKAALKKNYVVWFYLIIIYDVNNFKVQWCGKPCSLPFQAWIPALPLPVSAPQSQSPLSSIEKIIPTP